MEGVRPIVVTTVLEVKSLMEACRKSAATPGPKTKPNQINQKISQRLGRIEEGTHIELNLTNLIQQTKKTQIQSIKLSIIKK